MHHIINTCANIHEYNPFSRSTSAKWTEPISWTEWSDCIWMRTCSHKWTLCHLSSCKHLMRPISDSRTPIYKWMQVICFYWLRLNGEKNMKFALFRLISSSLSFSRLSLKLFVFLSLLVLLSYLLYHLQRSISQKTATFSLQLQE